VIEVLAIAQRNLDGARVMRPRRITQKSLLADFMEYPIKHYITPQKKLISLY